MEKALKKAKEITEKVRPILGSEGYIIEAMGATDKTKNNVIIDNEAYHAYAVEALTAYCRVTVIGYTDDGYLKLMLQLPIRTVAVV